MLHIAAPAEFRLDGIGRVIAFSNQVRANAGATDSDCLHHG
jgi:hypothetical protein